MALKESEEVKKAYEHGDNKSRKPLLQRGDCGQEGLKSSCEIAGHRFPALERTDTVYLSE